MTTFHELNSRRTAEYIERRVQMEDETLIFKHLTKFHEGDGVSVKSSDGSIFIGEISDVAVYSGDGEYLCFCERIAPHVHVSLS